MHDQVGKFNIQMLGVDDTEGEAEPLLASIGSCMSLLEGLQSQPAWECADL